jgi:hypothetical protein
MSLPHDLSQINESHIQALVDAQAEETAYLEFKRQLPANNEKSKHEFLADISAFANSSGGELIYGIEEDGEGHASAIVAQEGNSDREVLRLQSMLADGVELRIPGVQFQPVSVTGGFVLIVRVPQSWAGPHRVRTNQHFFTREFRRKRQLDIPEVRALFLRSEKQAQHIRDFRTERLGKILAGETPRPLVRGPVLVVHFVPTQSVLGLVQIDPKIYMTGRPSWVMGASGWNTMPNADGALAYRVLQKEGTHGYSLMFRNGFFEAVDVLGSETEETVWLASLSYEEEIIKLLGYLRREYEYFGVGTEMTAMLSILGANRVRFGISPARFFLSDGQGQFDRATLALPDVLLPSDLPAETALRPMFDLVWQSAGFLRSFNYNDAGDWTAR